LLAVPFCFLQRKSAADLIIGRHKKFARRGTIPNLRFFLRVVVQFGLRARPVKREILRYA